MRIPFVVLIVAVVCAQFGCGSSQEHAANIDARPLEENRAFEIIEEMIAGRSYQFEKDVGATLANKKSLRCDYRVAGHPIAIEYLTEQDRITLGEIPAPAAGSRLHVLQAQTIPANPGTPAEQLYILFIDDRKFIYQFNPTSDQRADVTFPEVDSRLRRDLADFLSWYETKVVKR